MKYIKIFFIVLFILLIISLSIFLLSKFRVFNDSRVNTVELLPMSKKDATFKATPFESILKDNNSGYIKKGNYIIKNIKDWEKIWKIANYNRGEPPILPIVDFQNEMIIAVFADKFPTLSYTTEIKKLEENLRIIKVTIENSSSTACWGARDMESLPFHIIKTKKTNKEIIFIEINEESNC